MSELRVENIRKIYHHKEVVKGICFYLKAGEIVGLLGPNGAGKTTTFYIIVGIIKPYSGNIFLDKENIVDLPIYKRARMGISYLPQEPSVFRGLTVEENIIAILENYLSSKKEISKKTDELLEEFEISHLATQKAYTLSGGERRRVEIARALALEPKFLLLDEPFAGIDPITVVEIQKLVIKLKKKNIGVLITDHNVRETLKITDRSYIIYDGKILISGDANKLLKSKKARKIYLGKEFRM